MRNAARAALASFTFHVLAQQPAQPPVFRAHTRLVQVNVVVHDRHGAPITDLKKEDFTLVERGKPQQIAFFSMDAAGAAAKAPEPLPPHIFSNAVAQRAGVAPGVTVLLVDAVNTGFFDQKASRDALIAFLKQIQPQDRIGLYVLGRRGLTLLHDYTTDASSLVARLHAAKGELSADLDASTLDASEQQDLRDMGLGDFAEANQRVADFYTTNRVVNTLSAFEAIAQHLSGLPGRKSLVWLSGGFPLSIGFDELPEAGATFSTRDQRIFTRELESAVRALNNSGIAVYPVDARRLLNPTNFSAESRRPPGGNGRGLPSLASTNAPIDTMLTLADRTGGRAAYNTNDLTSAIRRAVEDGRVTYTLGYYSTDESQDGRFRDIKVSVDRPHLDVRARKGYFAMRPADRSAEARRREIQGAVWSPMDATALALDARVDFIDTPPDTINVFVQVDSSSLAFRHEGDRWKAELDVVCVEKDDHGALQGNGAVDNLSLALTDDNYKKVVEHGFIHQTRLPRAAAATTLRIVVRDAATGETGSVTVPFSKVLPAGK